MAIKLGFFLLAMLALQSKAEIGGSFSLFDAPGQSYIRRRPLEIDAETKALSTSEVAATISILLGLAPPTFLSPESSSKLNEVMTPNPFDKPRSVFFVEVVGVNDPILHAATTTGSVLGSEGASIPLTDEDEVTVTRLDATLDSECDAACVEEELKDLAEWLEGTSSDGRKLSFPLSSFEMSKGSGRQFALSLVALLKNIKKAVELQEDIAGTNVISAELLMCRFTGIESLREEYGSGETVQHGIEILEGALTKSFELLQKSREGKIVGIILSNNKQSSELGPLVDVEVSSREARLLEEATFPNSTIIAEIVLVRRSLAWITGIILLVSTLIGIYFLLYMPLTRDTLLYSNVKMD